MPRGNHRAFGDKRTCAHHGPRPDDRSVHHDRAHSDQRAVLDGAAVQNHPMSHGDVIAHGGRMAPGRDMNHRIVLDVGSPTDPNMEHVPAKDAPEPDRTFLAHFDVPDEHRRRRDEHVGPQPRLPPVVLYPTHDETGRPRSECLKASTTSTSSSVPGQTVRPRGMGGSARYARCCGSRPFCWAPRSERRAAPPPSNPAIFG